MDENHWDKVESELGATEVKLWHPPLSTRDQKKLDHFQKKRLPKWTGFADRTLWDWLQLLGVLAIPLAVAGATLFFGIQQANLANQQHDNDQKLANQQHEADQQSALDQQQAAILQTYIDNIQDLLLHDNLRGSKPSDEVAILARARTLTALQGLDPGRKGQLVRFLYEAQLIGFQSNKVNKYNKIIDLSLADLHNVDFSGANLSYANLSYANLSHANLSHANLSGANLYNVDFSYADLSGADLSGADLTLAIFLTQQQFDQVFSCKDAILFLLGGLTCHRT